MLLVLAFVCCARPKHVLDVCICIYTYINVYVCMYNVFLYMCAFVCVSVYALSQCHARRAYAFSLACGSVLLLSLDSIGWFRLFGYAAHSSLYKALFSCLIFSFVMLTALRQGLRPCFWCFFSPILFVCEVLFGFIFRTI